MTVRIYETPEYMKHLPIYDHTSLSAVNSCPTLGVLRYGMHKIMPNAGRAMALEAGAACHDVFAAIRFYQLTHTDRMPDHAAYWGPRVFGGERWAQLLSTTKPGNTESANAVNFALEALATSGYYDDPDDKRRSMSNLEATCLEYLNHWEWTRYPIWVADRNDPTKRVGIEVPIDMIIDVTDDEVDNTGDYSPKLMRYVGRMDGLHWNGSEAAAPLIVHENKTGGRLDLAWRMSFLMSHQVTGYTQGASVISNTSVKRAIVLGAQLPLPKEYGNGIVYENATREPFHVQRWIDWAFRSKAVYEQFANDPFTATKYTHSCNAYFRPCAYIPFCYEDNDGMHATVELMETDAWNPLHEHSPTKASE